MQLRRQLLLASARGCAKPGPGSRLPRGPEQKLGLEEKLQMERGDSNC